LDVLDGMAGHMHGVGLFAKFSEVLLSNSKAQ
jgi:hypothetical protein